MNIGTLVAYKSVVNLNCRCQTSQESCDSIKRLQTTYSTYPFKLYIKPYSWVTQNTSKRQKIYVSKHISRSIIGTTKNSLTYYFRVADTIRVSPWNLSGGSSLMTDNPSIGIEINQNNATGSQAKNTKV